MNETQRTFKVLLISLLIFQLTGCGTLLYPERRGQMTGRLDIGVVLLDALGLFFFIIPGVIAFAVDFSNGTIYLPTRPVVISMADLKQVKFDPKHTSFVQFQKIIKGQTGFDLVLTRDNLRVSRLQSRQDMMEHFAQMAPEDQSIRYAYNR
jgi:hypothetical protein